MASKTTLIYFAVRRPAKWESPILKVIHSLNRFFRQDEGSVLVHEVIASLDRVKSMPFRFVFLDVAKGRANPPLGSPGMTPYGIKL
jgi:hypothetical protein